MQGAEAQRPHPHPADTARVGERERQPSVAALRTPQRTKDPRP